MRSLVFVDGTNVLMRLAETISANIRADKPALEVIDLANKLIRGHLKSELGEHMERFRQRRPVLSRTYWFGSYRGNQDERDRIAAGFRERGIEARLVLQHGRRSKGQPDREKGVDMAVAREMLINSFHKNMEVAVLVAGDEDYLGLVDDVKRYGVEVWGAAFNKGRSERLYLACDEWIVLDNLLEKLPREVEAVRRACPHDSPPTEREEGASGHTE